MRGEYPGRAVWSGQPRELHWCKYLCEKERVATTLGMDTTAVAPVVDAVISAHAARGNRVLDIPLLEMVHVSVAADTAAIRSVVVAADRVVELVLDDGPFEAVGPAVWALAARGWDVVALTPASRVGEAHRALRGTPCRLQPWWTDAAAVRFGKFETP